MQVSEAVSSLQSTVSSTSARSSLENRFQRALEALLTTGDRRLAIALSGGADSMALTLLAHDWVHTHGGHIVALTVDHGLRTESRAEAEQVATGMHERGIAHHILTPEHRDVSNNLQEAARIWRYDALADFCAGHGLLHCLVAHHAGDNRENFLHNQTRGDTLDGSSGMARIRCYRGVRFLRPMLGLERTDIEDFLRSKHAAWIDDPSNQNTKFARVRHRNMLHENAAKNAALDDAIEKNAAARTARDHALAHAAIQCVTIHPLGYAQLDAARWQTLEAPVMSQLLADTITTISGGTSRPRAADTARLVQALQRADFRTRTLQQCEISLQHGSIRIAREPARVEAPVTLSGHGTRTWDGRFRVHYALPEHHTYTLRALGHDGRKQLARHYPHDTTIALPLATPSLWHLDELVSAPHIDVAFASIPGIRIGFAPPKPLAPAPFW